MDLSPRRAAPVKSTTRPAATSARTTSQPATALHSRVRTAKGENLLDLRAANAPKPAPAVQRAANHIPAAAPKTTVHERHTAHVTDRLEHAKRVDRSPHINKFANGLASGTPQRSAPVQPAPAPTPAALELPQITATQHEAMTRLAQPAPAPTPAPGNPVAKPRRRLNMSLTPHSSRALATTAAVAIMAGYVWMQNYPKLALQNASNQAGLTASLPSYMPSSYTLAHTDTKPGLVTLNFASPSASSALKIAQTRTSWDSSSLLDNYVIKNTDDYATVQGQGLTIYLFGQNQATWVNHGIRYSIEGATRLSREQILKIAYSL
ncbi:MAG: hypothetical protein JWN01_680 [Patescibacteria group bacterium]|nr:hypothetical protein [Patescibacteria group bacterium]